MLAFWKKIKPWHYGSAVGLLTFLPLALGWRRCGEFKSEFAFLIILSIAVGFLVFVFRRYNLKAWITVFLLGLVLGMASSVDLLWEVPFERQCFISLATILFWVVLASVVGSIAEFIRFIHRLAHSIGNDTEEKMKELINKNKI